MVFIGLVTCTTSFAASSDWRSVISLDQSAAGDFAALIDRDSPDGSGFYEISFDQRVIHWVSFPDCEYIAREVAYSPDGIKIAVLASPISGDDGFDRVFIYDRGRGDWTAQFSDSEYKTLSSVQFSAGPNRIVYIGDRHFSKQMQEIRWDSIREYNFDLEEITTFYEQITPTVDFGQIRAVFPEGILVDGVILSDELRNLVDDEAGIGNLGEVIIFSLDFGSSDLTASPLNRLVRVLNDLPNVVRISQSDDTLYFAAPIEGSAHDDGFWEYEIVWNNGSVFHPYLQLESIPINFSVSNDAKRVGLTALHSDQSVRALFYQRQVDFSWREIRPLDEFQYIDTVADGCH